MKAKPPQCEKVYLAAHLLLGEFCLLAIGLDEAHSALIFDEVNSADLDEFKNILKLYSNEYKTRIWIYRDELLEAELQGCQLNPVQSCSKQDTLAIVTNSLLTKKKIQIESTLSLKRKLTKFKGQSPSSQVLALFCAVEQLQNRLNSDRLPMRQPLVSVIPRLPVGYDRGHRAGGRPQQN